MDEFPKKIKTYSMDLYSGGGPGDTRELPIEWDILAAASARSLVGRVRGWLENEIIQKTPASVLWRLWNYELGEFGTFEVRKIRPGWSQVTFSGFGFPPNFPDKIQEFKLKQHMQDSIDNYYFMLSQENIFPGPDGPATGQGAQPASTNTLEKWHTQLHILNGKERKENIEVVKLWCAGRSGGEISIQLALAIGTVYNIISKARRKYPGAKIPKDRERKK